MHISDFTIQQAVLEIRYPPQYLLWDRSGAFWSSLLMDYPNITYQQVSPNDVTFRSKSEFELSLKLESAVIVFSHPQRTLLGFKQLCERFVAEIDSHLKPTLFTRVGCRLVYEKRFSKFNEAEGAVRSLALAKAPQGSHFGFDQAPTPEYIFTFRNATSGAHVRISASERSLRFDQLPLLWAAEPLTEKSYFSFIFDVDQYLTGPVLRSQLHVTSWIDECLHRINRDSENFLR
jgi:hypothetical protein